MPFPPIPAITEYAPSAGVATEHHPRQQHSADPRFYQRQRAAAPFPSMPPAETPAPRRAAPTPETAARARRSADLAHATARYRQTAGLVTYTKATPFHFGGIRV